MKFLILAVLAGSCLSLASLFFLGLLKNHSLNLLIWSGVLWLSAFALLPILFLVASQKQFYFFNLLLCFIPFLPIFSSGNWEKNLFFASGAILAANLIAGWRMQAEANNSIKLNVLRIIAKGMLFLTLSSVIALGSLAYFGARSLNTPELNLMSSADFAINSFGKSFQLGGSIDDVLGIYIAGQINKLGFDGDSAKNLLLEQTKTNLAKMLGIEISGQETISALVVAYFQKHWQGMTPPLKLSGLVLLFFVAQGILALFNYIFSFLVIPMSWFFLKVFLLIKYLQIKKTGIEKEEIAFS